MKGLLCAAVAALCLASPALSGETRTVDAVYTATLTQIPAGTKSLRVWIPLPKSSAYQTVSDIRIDSTFPWTRGHEDEYGNDYVYTTIADPPSEISVRITFHATRRADLFTQAVFEHASNQQLARNLRADTLVTLSKRVRSLADEVTADRTTTLDRSRAIYDYLLRTMTYDKTEPGWGHGDTERACDIRKGNCTDFHSLFISLARAKGIPARFIVGFPMSSHPAGESAGYHCWAEFYVDGKGWVPLDASDASKSTDPRVRDFLFGNLDPDRIEFTTGRDLKLRPATVEPLNFFIYPYAEADGKPAGTPSISLKYQDAAATAPRVIVQTR